MSLSRALPRLTARLTVGLICAIAIGLGGPTAQASADCTATAFLNVLEGINSISYRGNAVGCYRSRTYSWRLRLYRNGSLYDEHINQGLKGSSSYSTPLYETFWGYGANGWCVRFFIYHSRTVGNNKVDEDTDCEAGGVPPAVTLGVRPGV